MDRGAVGHIPNKADSLIVGREGIPTALALVPNKRPKALKKVMDEVGCELWK